MQKNIFFAPGLPINIYPRTWPDNKEAYNGDQRQIAHQFIRNYFFVHEKFSFIII